MTGAVLCPGCHSPLPLDAPQGLCPNCLLQFAFVADEPPASTAGYRPAFEPPAPADLARSFPQLEILELLGQGGMGAVYKARQVKLDRLVALKIVPPEMGREPAFAERFAREARALARLGHANIVAVHDFGEVNGLFYFIMEYVDGVNLRQMLQSGQVRPPDALRIVQQVCDALQYAHDQGVVHRDIKPENILVDRRGQVKIADFGLAKLLGPATGSANLTGSRQVMGTPHYMAPEQIQRPLDVDQRADIYSLGVVLYELLTGELPLGRFAPPSQKAGTDVRLDDVVLRTLEKEPARRYQQISHFKTDLEAIGRFLLGGDGEDGGDPARIEGALLHDLVAAGGILAGLAVIGVATALIPGGLPAVGCLALVWIVHAYPWTSSTIKLLTGIGCYVGALSAISYVFRPLQDLVGIWVYIYLAVLAVSAYEFSQSFLTKRGRGRKTDAAEAEAAAPGVPGQDRELWQYLKDAADEHGLYLAPDLPAEGLHNARKNLGVPPSERILALLDFTGDEEDCKNSLLFGAEAIYFRGIVSGKDWPVAIPYEEFPERSFVNHGLIVYVGKDQFLKPDLDESPVDCEAITRMLEHVRDAVLRRRKAAAAEPPPAAN
jgi:tRNA A-37 threonylcarbamoyl transferase component Bud32